jgi:hypothetical protein
MMTETIPTPLLVGPAEIAALQQLREAAAKAPVNMTELQLAGWRSRCKRQHIRQMNTQTIQIPFAFFVTFLIETHHPNGNTTRHMSMSVKREGRLPHPDGVWMVAKELGFIGSLEQCDAVYIEKLSDGGDAVNVVQIISAPEAGRA